MSKFSRILGSLVRYLVATVSLSVVLYILFALLMLSVDLLVLLLLLMNSFDDY